jgi:gp45 sliding clamp, C terminal
MKLSSETLSVLKNFASINQGILFKPGKTIRTISTHKNILAEAVVSEEIPKEFGVYDLNNFLSVLSLHKEEPVIDFDDSNVLISGLQGRSKIKYRFCASNMIVAAPDKNLELNNPEIKFDLSAEDFDWILRAANVLSSPHIAVESDGKKVFVTAFDVQNDSAHTESLEVGKGDGNKYKMLFKTENLKMLSGGYAVTISSKGIAHFKHKTMSIQYWIATEAGSKYEKV